MREFEHGDYTRQLTEAAIKIAQQIAEKEGIPLGNSVVVNDGSGMVYKLESVEGDMATLVISKERSRTSEEVRKQVPFKNLADANLVYRISQELHMKGKLENPN